MKRLLVGGVALAALLSPASAVEINSGAEPLPPAEAVPYNWSGLYGRLNPATSYDASAFGVPGTGSTAAPDNFTGSAQFGYNYQMGSVVVGIEGDVARRRSSDFSNLYGASGSDSFKLRNEQGWIGTLRPRAGLAADNWLLYGTAGLAYGSVNTDTRSPVVASSPRTGWTVGGGVEFAGGKQWSLGLEYLYADYGKSSQSQLGQTVGGASFTTLGALEDRSQVVRGKLNIKFGWGESGK